jgi:hypothetical protein
MPIELNRTYTLRLQVRGTLVNASLDDEPVIAWESPLPRNDGALQLITFDALCAFHEFTISPLDPKLPLRMPGSDPLSSPQTLKMAQAATESAQADLKVAEAALAVAIAELCSNFWSSSKKSPSTLVTEHILHVDGANIKAWHHAQFLTSAISRRQRPL